MVGKDNLDAIVMAGGLGTRMHSPIPKMLMPILGRPLVAYAVDTVLQVTEGIVTVVAGDFIESMREQVGRCFPDRGLRFARQQKPLGTADAVRAGMTELPDSADVIIVNGDVPNMPPELLARLIQKYRNSKADLAFLAFHTEDPTGYGRVINDDSGNIQCIREEKELKDDEREIELVNAGVYVANAQVLREFLAAVQPSPVQKEYLLTDLVSYVAEHGGKSTLLVTDDPMAVEGVNNRAQLSFAARQIRERRNRDLMIAGVSMPQPDSVDIDFGVVMGRNITVEAGVAIRGASRVEDHCTIGRGCVLEDTEVGISVKVRPYCVLEGTRIGPGCAIGPFAHTRAGTVLEEGAKVGNFVETKKTVVGKGSKASHLSYLGDAIIGAGVNIGAGTITCNYDGYRKYPTVLEDGVFIGSDTQLVAPVTVGKDAVVAAGTTVTRDVSPGALVLTRVEQAEVPGYAEKKRKKMQKP